MYPQLFFVVLFIHLATWVPRHIDNIANCKAFGFRKEK